MARHADPTGRFDIAYERLSLFDGIQSELQETVGQVINWMVFDSAESEIDPVYAVSSQTGGRKRKRSVPIKTFGAIIYQGTSTHNERGFYNVDTLRVSFAADQVMKLLPDIVTEPDLHIFDRIAYRGRLFVPSTLYLRGIVEDRYTVITLDANQVNPEEAVNDHQLTHNESSYTVIGAEDDEYLSEYTYQDPEDSRPEAYALSPRITATPVAQAQVVDQPILYSPTNVITATPVVEASVTQ